MEEWNNKARWYERGECIFQCRCPGTMSEWVEEEGGDFMKIAHSAIIAKLMRCLSEWRKISGQQNEDRPTEEKRKAEEAVGNQLRELEKFEAENRTKHCGIDVWMILIEYGWIR